MACLPLPSATFGRPPLNLFLARDHFGIKPFYYSHFGHRFAFASEIKALLEVPGIEAELDPESLHQYLAFLWVPEPKTMFRGIRSSRPVTMRRFGTASSASLNIGT